MPLRLAREREDAEPPWWVGEKAAVGEKGGDGHLRASWSGVWLVTEMLGWVASQAGAHHRAFEEQLSYVR